MPKKGQGERETGGQTDRLGAILGGTGDRLPRVGLETLRQFHGHHGAGELFGHHGVTAEVDRDLRFREIDMRG